MFKSPMNIFRMIAGLFAVIGIGLLIGAVLNYRSTTAFLATAQTATGTIIGYERHNNSEGEIFYYPVITFTPQGDAEIEFTASTGSSGRPYRIGAEVPLRYNPALPFEAVIDTPTDLWIGVFVLSLLGVVFTAVGCGLFWFFRPQGAVAALDFTTPTFDDAAFEKEFAEFDREFAEAEAAAVEDDEEEIAPPTQQPPSYQPPAVKVI